MFNQSGTFSRMLIHGYHFVTLSLILPVPVLNSVSMFHHSISTSVSSVGPSVASFHSIRIVADGGSYGDCCSNPILSCGSLSSPHAILFHLSIILSVSISAIYPSSFDSESTCSFLLDVPYMFGRVLIFAFIAMSPYLLSSSIMFGSNSMKGNL